MKQMEFLAVKPDDKFVTQATGTSTRRIYTVVAKTAIGVIFGVDVPTGYTRQQTLFVHNNDVTQYLRMKPYSEPVTHRCDVVWCTPTSENRVYWDKSRVSTFTRPVGDPMDNEYWGEIGRKTVEITI